MRRARRIGSFADEFYTGVGDYPEDAAPSGVGYGAALEQSAPYVGDLPTDPDAGDLSTWERFAQAAKRFQDAWNEFDALPIDANDPFYGEYLALHDRAGIAAETMQGIANAAGSVWNWAKQAVGLSGARRAVRGVAGLGVAPILTYAAITGAIALLIGVTNSMLKFIADYRRRQRVFEINVERAQRGERPIDVPGAGEETTVFGDASKLAKWIALGFIVFYAAPPIVRALEKRK